MEWIDAKETPPDLTCDIVAFVSWWGNRPEVLYLATQPYKYYFDCGCDEIPLSAITHYINLPKLN